MAGAEQEIGHHCRGFGDRFCCGIFLYKSRNAEQGRLILYGNVDIRQISLAFNSNGRIEEMLKEEGDAVKAGDVLARLDTRPLELAIAQRRR